MPLSSSCPPADVWLAQPETSYIARWGAAPSGVIAGSSLYSSWYIHQTSLDQNLCLINGHTSLMMMMTTTSAGYSDQLSFMNFM